MAELELTNALLHGGGSGRLELRRDTDAGLRVIDHGPGFACGVPQASTPPPWTARGRRDW